MTDTIRTLNSFPELIDELRAAKKQGARLISTAPNPQLGQAIGFKLSDGSTYRITLARLREFEPVADGYADLKPLFSLVSTNENRIKLFQTC